MQTSHVASQSQKTVVRCLTDADGYLSTESITKQLAALNPHSEALSISLSKLGGAGGSSELVGARATFLSAGDSWAAVFRRHEDGSAALVMETTRENEYFALMEEDGTSKGRQNWLSNSLLIGSDSVKDTLRRYEPVNLQTGDIVLLASDGIDALDQTRLLKLLQDAPGLQQVAEAISEDLSYYARGAKTMDDTSLVLFKYTNEGDVRSQQQAD